MNATKAIQAILAAASGVTALTSRIYSGRAPRTAAAPYVVHNQIAATPVTTMDGPNTTEQADVQIDCYAQTGSDAMDLAEAVRIAVDGYAGTIATINVRATVRNNQFNAEPLPPTDGSDTPRYRVVVLFSMIFEQAIS